MKRFLIGFLAGLLILPVGAFFFLKLGFAPVATSSNPIPFERYLAQIALNARIKHDAPRDSPMQPTEPNLMAGAKLYREYCAVCHGLPGQEQTAIAKGEFPPPPHFFKGKGVTDDPVGETFWKIKNGIRLTGMPSFEGSLSGNQMWQISLLLATEKLPDNVLADLKQPSEAAQQGALKNR